MVAFALAKETVRRLSRLEKLLFGEIDLLIAPKRMVAHSMFRRRDR